MMKFRFLFLLCTIVTTSVQAQFAVDINPLTTFNDLILYRDYDGNALWHTKVFSDGTFGFTATGVADARLTIRRDGGVGINGIPATDELLIMKTNPNDGFAKFILKKNGDFRIRGNGVIEGNGVFDGNLGVGVTPSSQVALSVKATAQNDWVIYTDDAASDVKFYVLTNGDAYLKGSLTQNSDIRLKEKLEEIKNPLSKIRLLNGYSYFWKHTENSSPEKQFGVSAQEVQAIFPELVKEKDDGYLSVNYSGLIPVLIEGMNEQQDIIDSQSSEIDELKSRLEVLEKTISKMR